MTADPNRAVARLRLPPGYVIGYGPTRTLLALVRLHHREGRATVLGVAREAGRTSPQPTHAHLVQLADLNLVAVGTPGGLRPLCTTHQPGASA